MRLDQLLEKIARTKVALEVSHRGAPEAKAKEQPRREAGSPKGNGRKARLTRVSPALDELEEIVPRLDRVLVGVIHLIVTLIGWVLFIAAKLQS